MSERNENMVFIGAIFFLIFIAICATATVYLVESFIHWDFDPQSWPKGSRGWAIIWSIFLTWIYINIAGNIAGIIRNETEKEETDNNKHNEL
jgi:hypothetical protein